MCARVRACVHACVCVCVCKERGWKGGRDGEREEDMEEGPCELHQKPHQPPPTFVLAQGAVALGKQQPRRAVLVVWRRHLTQVGTDTQSQVHYLHKNFGPTPNFSRVKISNDEAV